MTHPTRSTGASDAGRWVPDKEHWSLAHRVECDMGTRLFEEAVERPGRIRHGIECEDLTEREDRWEQGLYDPEVWPIVYVDEAGRRLEVDIEVHVRPLPSVEVQAAALRAEVERTHRELAGQRRLALDEAPASEGEVRS
jgi:hypothetical protein